MSSAASAPATTNNWLLDHGPEQLEQLFRVIACHISRPVLIADDDGQSLAASTGAGRLLGLPPEKIVGRPIDDLAMPSLKPQVSQQWHAFLEKGEEEGRFPLKVNGATTDGVDFIAKKDVLPKRHVVTLSGPAADADEVAGGSDSIPSWVQDYALFLLDCDVRVVAWYAGATRIYGYEASEAIGRLATFLYPDVSDSDKGAPDAGPRDECMRAAIEGHRGTESWHVRKDGSRFWASSITLALNDDSGCLQGFARVVRDFTDRHEHDEALRRDQARAHIVQAPSTGAGVISGQLEGTPEANDTFLKMVGYSREDLVSNRMVWQDLTPAQYTALDDAANEEALRFGACAPYRKEFVAKDGTRVLVLVTTVVLKLCPFRWISLVTDLRERDRAERIDQDANDTSGNTGTGNAGAVMPHFEEFVGSSAPMKRVMAQIAMVAPTDATVLVLGETGTGKELVARAVHRLSPRRTMPFISLNCAAIPTGLLESELFGYERGAFTGALAQKIGRFEMAHRGTLFLDEAEAFARTAGEIV